MQMLKLVSDTSKVIHQKAGWWPNSLLVDKNLFSIFIQNGHPHNLMKNETWIQTKNAKSLFDYLKYGWNVLYISDSEKDVIKV